MISNCTALVTGASRGLGLEISRALALKNCKLVLVSRNQARLKLVVDELNSKSKNHIHRSIAMDVSDINDIENKFKAHKDVLSSINILVNCAGVMQSKLLISTPKDETLNLLNTNLLGSIAMCQKVAKNMLKPKMKHEVKKIVNISSVLGGDQLLNGTSIYSATKSGLNQFSLVLAQELASKVQVNSVAPTLISDTEMGKIGPSELTKADVATKVMEILESDISGSIVRV